jgi:hypothetical protein
MAIADPCPFHANRAPRIAIAFPMRGAAVGYVSEAACAAAAHAESWLQLQTLFAVAAQDMMDMSCKNSSFDATGSEMSDVMSSQAELLLLRLV